MKINRFAKLTALLSLILFSPTKLSAFEDCFPGEMFEYNKMLFYIAPGENECRMIDFIYVKDDEELSKINTEWNNYTNNPDRLIFLRDVDYSGDVVVPSEVEYNGTTYPVTSVCCWTSDLFRENETTSVTIPGSVKLVSGFTNNYKTLDKIVLNEGVEKIDGFRNLSTSELILPNSLTEIAQNSLSYLTGLEEFTFPPLITIADSGILNNMNGLKKLNTNNVEVVNDNFCCKHVAMKGYSKLIIDFGNVKKIAGTAFEGVESLYEVELPESIEELGEECFANNPNLYHIILPSHPVKMYNAFPLDESLIKEGEGVRVIYSYSDEPYELNGTFDNPILYDRVFVTVPYVAVERYKLDPEWGKFKHIDPPVGVEVVTLEKFEAMGGVGNISVTTSAAVEVKVYSMDGKCVSSDTITGETEIPVAAGTYLVTYGKGAIKVIVK